MDVWWWQYNNKYTSESAINISPQIPRSPPKPTRQLTQGIKTLEIGKLNIIIKILHTYSNNIHRAYNGRQWIAIINWTTHMISRCSFKLKEKELIASGSVSQKSVNQPCHLKIWLGLFFVTFCIIWLFAWQLQLDRFRLDRVGLKPQKSGNPLSGQNVTFDPTISDWSNPSLWFCTHSLMRKKQCHVNRKCVRRYRKTVSFVEKSATWRFRQIVRRVLLHSYYSVILEKGNIAKSDGYLMNYLYLNKF